MDRIEEIETYAESVGMDTVCSRINELTRKLNWALGMIESQQMVINGMTSKDVYMSPTAKLIAEEIIKVQDMATKVPLPEPMPVVFLTGFDTEGDITKLEFKVDREDARGKFVTGACYRLILESE